MDWMGKPCYDIEGYVSQCEPVCYECATSREKEECDPIFASSEWDYQPHCIRCEKELDVVIIDYDSF